MNKIRTNVSLDPKAKKEATKILDELGLDLSGAINLFLKQVVINEGLPFDISKSKNNIFYKYNQLKKLIENYLGFKEVNEQLEKIKSGK